MKADEKKIEIRVGIFVLVGLGITMASIIVLGGKQSVFTSVNHYTSHFAKIDGLVQGAKVTLGGLQIGSVGHLSFDPKQRDMKVEFTVEREFSSYIRKDSSVEVVTQGVLGDKYLSVVAGDPAQPEIEDHGEVTQGASKDLSQIISSSDQLVHKLSETTESLERILNSFNKGNRADQFFQGLSTTSKNLSEVSSRINEELAQSKLKSTLGHLNSIMEKIDHGEGSLGAFINDPGLYDDAKALVGQVNRNRIMRNLIRQTIKDNKDKGADSP